MIFAWAGPACGPLVHSRDVSKPRSDTCVDVVRLAPDAGPGLRPCTRRELMRGRAVLGLARNSGCGSSSIGGSGRLDHAAHDFTRDLLFFVSRPDVSPHSNSGTWPSSTESVAGLSSCRGSSSPSSLFDLRIHSASRARGRGSSTLDGLGLMAMTYALYFAATR